MSVVRIGVGVALFGLVAAGCSSKPTPVADETDLHDVAQTQAAVIGECPYGMVMGGAQDTTSTGKPFRSCIATQGQLNSVTSAPNSSYECGNADAGPDGGPQNFVDTCSGNVPVPSVLAALGCTTGVLVNETYVFACPSSVTYAEIGVSALGLSVPVGDAGAHVIPPCFALDGGTIDSGSFDGECEALAIVTSPPSSTCFGPLQSGWELVIDRATLPQTPTGPCDPWQALINPAGNLDPAIVAKCWYGGKSCHACGVNGVVIVQP